MSLIYSGAATATVASNTTSIAITGLDLGTVLPGMTISLGARGRLTGDSYIIATVAPSGTSGGTLTVLDPVGAAFNSAGFVIDTRDFNGTAPNYLIATYTQVLNALMRLTSPLTNLFTGSRVLALDKETPGAISRLLYAIGGRTWGTIEQRSLSYTPTGSASVTTEGLSVRAFPDGTTPVDALTIDLGTGGVDVRRGASTMAAAATVDLGSAPTPFVALIGTSTIMSFGVGRRLERWVNVVDGGATLTHNGTSLVLPNGSNILTAPGDCFHVTSDGAGNWRLRSYLRFSGRPLFGTSSADITDSTATGRAAITASNAAALASAAGVGPGNSPTFAALTLSGAISAASFAISGSNAIALSGDYTIFYNVAGGLSALTVGNNDPSSYHRNNFHYYQSKDGSKTYGFFGPTGLTLNTPLKLPQYTTGTLPAGEVGAIIFIANARKSFESAGNGSGIPVYFSNSNWRSLYNDNPILT